MSIKGDLIVLAALAAAFVILLVVFIRILPRNNRLHRNITRIQSRLLCFGVLALMVCVAFAWAGRLRSSGVGKLFTDADSATEFIAAVNSGTGTVEIIVEGSEVTVSGRHFDDPDSAREEMIKRLESTDDITVIDRYGRADTVMEVLGILDECGCDIGYEDVLIEEQD